MLLIIIYLLTFWVGSVLGGVVYLDKNSPGVTCSESSYPPFQICCDGDCQPQPCGLSDSICDKPEKPNCGTNAISGGQRSVSVNTGDICYIYCTWSTISIYYSCCTCPHGYVYSSNQNDCVGSDTCTGCSDPNEQLYGTKDYYYCQFAPVCKGLDASSQALGWASSALNVLGSVCSPKGSWGTLAVSAALTAYDVSQALSSDSGSTRAVAAVEAATFLVGSVVAFGVVTAALPEEAVLFEGYQAFCGASTFLTRAVNGLAGLNDLASKVDCPDAPATRRNLDEFQVGNTLSSRVVSATNPCSQLLTTYPANLPVLTSLVASCGNLQALNITNTTFTDPDTAKFTLGMTDMCCSANMTQVTLMVNFYTAVQNFQQYCDYSTLPTTAIPPTATTLPNFAALSVSSRSRTASRSSSSSVKGVSSRSSSKSSATSQKSTSLATSRPYSSSKPTSTSSAVTSKSSSVLPSSRSSFKPSSPTSIKSSPSTSSTNKSSSRSSVASSSKKPTTSPSTSQAPSTSSRSTVSLTSSSTSKPSTTCQALLPNYAQCGGGTYTGPTKCQTGWSCQVVNVCATCSTLSQCLPMNSTCVNPVYKQCGGDSWTSSTCCPLGASCVLQPDKPYHFRQCIWDAQRNSTCQ